MMLRNTLTITIALLFVAQAGVAPAAAQYDGPIDGMFAAAEESTILNALEGLRDGLVGRASDAVAGVGNGPNATELAGQFQTTFNSNSGDYQQWANNRSTASTSLDVLAVTFSQNDSNETVFLTADVVDGEYRNASVVDTTDREPDESCELEGNAARNAADELGTFDERFVAEDGNVTNDYLASMGSRYGGNVECSFSTEGL